MIEPTKEELSKYVFSLSGTKKVKTHTDTDFFTISDIFHEQRISESNSYFESKTKMDILKIENKYDSIKEQTMLKSKMMEMERKQSIRNLLFYFYFFIVLISILIIL